MSNPTTSSSSSSSSSSRPTVLVTGGCGYIGSHTIVSLLESNYNIVVLDNLSNSSVVSLERAAAIANVSTAQERDERVQFHQVDVCDEPAVRRVFEARLTPFSSCIHFCGFKAVGESTRVPLKYYENNLQSTFVLLNLLDEFHCHSLVFSSSATVYGSADVMPITEQTSIGHGITNAYGRTKHMIEEILRDFYKSQDLQASTHKLNDWSITILRYFNPVGAHPSGKIGEDPNGPPNNLMPYVSQVAIGRRDYLTVFGDDYPTPDGTGVRDYLHVMDLAEGHLSAMEYMIKHPVGIFTFNLGTGTGYSVLDMARAMSDACGHEVPYQIGERRPGDIATCYADASLAKTEMGWEAKRGLEEMCRDLWAWQKQNPNGYSGADEDKGA